MNEPPSISKLLSSAEQSLEDNKLYECLRYARHLQNIIPQPPFSLTPNPTRGQQRSLNQAAHLRDNQHFAAARLITIAKTLIAAETPATNSYDPDWYAILRLPLRCNDPQLIENNHHQLHTLIYPDHTPFPNSRKAFEIINQAHSVLTDPIRKHIFDGDLRRSGYRRPTDLDYQEHTLLYHIEIHQQILQTLSPAALLMDAALKSLCHMNYHKSKEFILGARALDQQFPGLVRIFTVVNTLIAAQKRLPASDTPDRYAILRVGRNCTSYSQVHINFRLLYRLLTVRNAFPLAGEAAKLVYDAYIGVGNGLWSEGDAPRHWRAPDGSLFVKCQRCPRILHDANDLSIWLCRSCKDDGDSKQIESLLDTEADEYGNILLGQERLEVVEKEMVQESVGSAIVVDKAMGQENVGNANVVDDEDIWICKHCQGKVYKPDMREVYKCEGCGVEYDIGDGMNLYDLTCKKRKSQS